MKVGQTWKIAFGIAALGAVAVVGVSPSLRAQAPATPEVTYAKHIAPILQRSCENCHRPGGGGPMPLTSYEEVRPWARAICLISAMLEAIFSGRSPQNRCTSECFADNSHAWREPPPR